LVIKEDKNDFFLIKMEQFNYFASLPNEMLMYQCEKMDLQTLGKFRQAYDRANQVCKNVYERKLLQSRIPEVKQIPEVTLSDSQIYLACEQMDDQSLSNFAMHNNRVLGICSKILIDRGFRLSDFLPPL